MEDTDKLDKILVMTNWLFFLGCLNTISIIFTSFTI